MPVYRDWLAYPRPVSELPGRYDGFSPAQDGMTYRMWLVGQALAGYCAADVTTPKENAEAAVMAADYVLAQLEKES